MSKLSTQHNDFLGEHITVRGPKKNINKIHVTLLTYEVQSHKANQNSSTHPFADEGTSCMCTALMLTAILKIFFFKERRASSFLFFQKGSMLNMFFGLTCFLFCVSREITNVVLIDNNLY